jgi:hypothetical protein
LAEIENGSLLYFSGDLLHGPGFNDRGAITIYSQFEFCIRKPAGNGELYPVDLAFRHIGGKGEVDKGK